MPSVHENYSNQYSINKSGKINKMIVNKPWELGSKSDGSFDLQESAGRKIPDFCIGNYAVVKLVPPKGKSIRSGLVSTLLLTSFEDEAGEVTKTIEWSEDPSGYKISFPLGKWDLIATKFRGPKNYYRYQDPVSKEFYKIPQEKFTLEYAQSYCETNVEGWKDKSPTEKEQLIDEYFNDMYTFGMSQDLVLPIKGDEYTAPEIGMLTKLYRVYTPPSEGEKYPDIKATKWEKGKPSLTGDFETLPTELANALYAEQQRRDAPSVANDFDPTTTVEDSENDQEEIF